MYHEVLAQVCRKYGKVYSKDLQQRMLGGTDRHISERVVKELQINVSVDKFEKELLRLSEKVLPNAPLQRGAKRLLKHLDDNKIPVALATNSTAEQVKLHAQAKPDFFKIFHHVVTATDSDVCRGKPYPDLYIAAAMKFCEQPNPENCLVFEDSAVGLQAGITAGMQVVLTPHQGIEPKYAEQAAMVLPNLLDFRPELFGLPPFKDNCGCGQQEPRSPEPGCFKPPPSADNPCANLRKPRTCPPQPSTTYQAKNWCSMPGHSLILLPMLISIISAILYRLW